MRERRPKFTRPETESAYCNRRLFERLDADARGGRALWIGAPAGSGKTTLLSSYASVCARPCAWMQLDESDRDASSLFANFTRAVNSLRRGKERREQYRDSGYASDLDAFAAHFFASVYRRLPLGTLVVIDDAQWLEQIVGHEAIMRAAVNELRDQTSLIVLSRHQPPAALARLRSQRTLRCYEWPDLRLDNTQARELLQHVCDVPVSAEQAATLNSFADGWAAGLVLLADQSVHQPRPSSHSIASAPQVVFDYFTAELFARLDEAQRDLLLSLSLLPYVTAADARKWTGRADAGALLEQLCRRQCFISCRPGRPPTFHIHPLFREFLQHRLRLEAPAAELATSCARAAVLFEKRGDFEAAAELFAQAGDAAEMAAFLCRRASVLLETGRAEIWLRCLEGLPASQMQADPWLLYWTGVCALPADTVRARECFIPAFNHFVDHGNRRGIFLTWARIIDSHVYESGGYAGLDEWLEKYDEMVRGHGRPLSAEAFVRVSVSRFNALMFRRSDSPALPAAERRLRRLMSVTPDVSARFLLGATLVRYYSWIGDIAALEAVMNRLRPQSTSPELAAFSRVVWAALTASNGWLLDSAQAGLEAAVAGTALAQETGIHLFDFHFLMQEAYSALALGDGTQTALVIERMGQTFKPERHVDMGHCVFVRGWLELTQGRNETALASMQEAMRVAEVTGSPYIIARALHGLGQAQAQSGAFDEAMASFRAAVEISEPHRFGPITYLVELCRAELHFASGETAQALEALRRGFRLGAKGRYQTIPHWTPRQLALLCSRALAADIESAYAREVIARQGLRPPSTSWQLATAWPWQVRIHTLGRFSLLVNGKPVAAAGKGQARPLDLLKLLVAWGPKQVPAGRVAETLWPDSEGDGARDALKTTLARLRMLVGRDAIELSDGCLTLAKQVVWSDLAAAEELLDEVLRTPPAAEQGEEILAIYRGDFLGLEPHSTWAIAPRERLRGKLVRAITAIGEWLLDTGRLREAANLFARALEVCELSEELYVGLMRSHMALDHSAEAMRVFERYRQIVGEDLGIGPSKALVALRERLTAQKPPVTQNS